MGAKFTLLTVFFLLLQQTWTADPIPDVNFINDAIPSIWTDWSDWSECSRSCDGGVSHQRRACRLSHCEGNAFRYKICNMQPCPDNTDFREKQCSEFNEVPYKGDQMTWKAYYHPREPCSLHCVNQYNDVELLAAKVQDGTRCRPGSLDMCIDGKCMPVGCDLEIGSTKTVDNCGVCGGNGKTCSLPLYQWNENTNTTCSLKCGGGYKITQPICQNTATGDIVDQHLCDISQMPEGRLLECNVEPCPPKWEAGEWSVCSQSCGSGIKTRRLYCVEEHNKTKTKVFNHLCKGHKPRMQESCNMQPCPPEWITGQWSKCSATCGQGIQTRSVTCNKNPADMMQCDPLKKPSTEQKCFADTSCQEEKYYSLYDEGPKSSAVSYNKDTEYRIQAEKLIGKQNGSPHAVFVAEEWGPCSVTCGEGFRKRKVYCKAHLDYMNVMTKFADDTCGGEKPIEIERCVNKPCTSDTIWDSSVQDGYSEDVKEDSISPKVAPGAYGKTYSWVKNGFTPCTATCLGGVQELIVNCIRDDDKKVVSPYLCDTKTQPAVITQTCNDHPCPPRWNVSEYSSCNKKCGMGIQTREVNCIHEVTMSNTVAVPHNMCEQPAPPDRQHCNFVDCPVEWYTSNWTKCSKVCGGGVKTRTVECRQITAQDRIVSHPDHMCEGRKPQSTTPCNGRPCGKNKKPGSHVISSADNQAFVQVNPNKQVSIKIGGRATVFLGTSMKIKCPTKNFDKERLVWEKDGKEVHNNGNYRILKKRGILKIETVSYSDNATFTCKAGSSSSSLIVLVKPPPGKLPASSEESAKQNNQLDPAIPMEISGKTNFELSEDISHERLSEYEKNQRKLMQKRPTTPKSLPPIGATTNEMISNQGTKHQMVDSLLPSGNVAPAASSGSRLTPLFFGILINLKYGENIRSQRMLMEEPEFEQLKHTVIVEPTTTENVIGATMVLGKGERDDVKFEWFITSWSNCSPPCGGTGFQIRAAHCMVKVNNVTQSVESNLCEDAGLPTPMTIQKCDTTECPHWITKDWQDCNSSRCFAWNTAMQKRDVYCQLANGTLVPDALCESSEKPITKQECYNDLCKGTWKVGDWTECYAPCDKEGVKYRILQCVWYGTKKPAGTACRDLPRPAVMRTCRGISCAEANHCKDQSKYCQNVKTLNMCNLRRYQVQCCHSCKDE